MLGQRVHAISQWGEPFCQSWRWIPTAILIGTVPLFCFLPLGVPGQQTVSAISLALMTVTFLRQDRWLSGVAFIGLTFLAHCIAAISIAYLAPQAASATMPGSQDYWHKQEQWIESGQDPEYELSNWVPSHLQLAGYSSLLTATSFGGLTFTEGFYQVDLMNYYNGRLMARSTDQTVSLAHGWHLWSILRGLGFLFLTFEIASLSFAGVTQTAVSTWWKRALRWTLGVAFLLGDGMVKFLMLGYVRERLFENLL